MTLFVREYSWMWNDLRLSLAECRVYAYIYGLTHGEKGGYDGSKRHLAELLGLDEKSVRNVLNTLTEKNLILRLQLPQPQPLPQQVQLPVLLQSSRPA